MEKSKETECKEAVKEDIARSEAMGFFKGERKEKVESVLDKVWELIKNEGLSISQAQFLSQGLSAKIKREKEAVYANMTIK